MKLFVKAIIVLFASMTMMGCVAYPGGYGVEIRSWDGYGYYYRDRSPLRYSPSWYIPSRHEVVTRECYARGYSYMGNTGRCINEYRQAIEARNREIREHTYRMCARYYRGPNGEFYCG